MVKNGLTKEQVEHVAKLAKLPLDTSEVEIFQEQLSEVVEYVGKISGLRTKDLGLRVERREDKMSLGREDMVRSGKCLTQEEATSGTENKHNGLFIVPAIFEE